MRRLSKTLKRTVIVESAYLGKPKLAILRELEEAYREMVEEVVKYAVENNAKSMAKLHKALYKRLREKYPEMPTRLVKGAIADAARRAKSFLRLKRLGLAERELPEVRRVSIWLDDHLWKPNGLTSIRVATHRGWITVELEPHKQYWKYINRGWRLASEAKIKLDRRNRRLIVYLTFTGEVEEYRPRGYLPVDVNENNVTILVDGSAYLFETNIEKLVLGYHYRRKSLQERYDKLYGVKSRIKRKAMRKLKERRRSRTLGGR